MEEDTFTGFTLCLNVLISIILLIYDSILYLLPQITKFGTLLSSISMSLVLSNWQKSF